LRPSFGPSVDAATKTLIETEKARISKDGSPFTGPITAQDGSVLVAAGVTPDYAKTEALNTVFVKGVIGSLPKG
jgi:basic membrane protein A and related proteins